MKLFPEPVAYYICLALYSAIALVLVPDGTPILAQAIAGVFLYAIFYVLWSIVRCITSD